MAPVKETKVRVAQRVPDVKTEVAAPKPKAAPRRPRSSSFAAAKVPKVELFPKDVLERHAGVPQTQAQEQADRAKKAGEVGANVPKIAERASERMSFDQLPAKLQETLKKSFPNPDEFWAKSGNSLRQSLSETYNRLDSMGLWKHISKIAGEHEAPAKPVKGTNVKVDGATGGLAYEVKDRKAFVDDLLSSKNYGIDPGWATMLHDHMTGLREANAPSGSLHISIGPGDRIDTHLDRVTPVDSPDAKTKAAKFNPARSIEHHSKEVWSDISRKVLPGVFVGVGPELADVNRSRTPQDRKTTAPPQLKDHDILGSVNFVFHFGGKTENRSPHRREQETAMVDAKVMERAVTKGTAQATSADFLPSGVKPKDVRAGNYIDPATLASSLAGHIARSAFDGRITAEFKMPKEYDQLSAKERKAMAAAIGKMAKAVYAELPAEARSVRSIKVSFGNKDEYLPLTD